MNRFKFWNTAFGWLSFMISFVVYLSTLEPSLSFWDCGEFIATSCKLQVCHPPGAPFYLMLTKVFSLLTSNPQRVALFVNAFSALTSAGTIMFLFWTITHLLRKMLNTEPDRDNAVIVTILGAGLIGAMAFTFSDSFWFSAVEAEVYATSSLFTAVVFWAILKWEEVSEEPYSNRWLILIAYLMGLSVGVHLLNLLAIPALALVFYFKKFSPSLKGFFIATGISMLLLAAFQFGIIPGIIYLATIFELYFVNSLHMPFNSGITVYLLLTIAIFTGSIWFTYRRRKYIAYTIVLSTAMFMMGYMSYAMVFIRSSADTPINENRPDNAFSLLSYINREQYGEEPFLHGPYYNAPIDSSAKYGVIYARISNRYDSVNCKIKRYYDPRFTTFFPRMYSTNTNHIEMYKDWGSVTGIPLTVKRNGEQVIEYKPTFLNNLTFFISYQVGFMYVRYFLWNFSGKQNEIDSDGGILYGNAITGFPYIDNAIYGPQELLPDDMKNNPGHNRYYMLPLLLGIAGMVYQFRKSRRNFSVVMLLFIMTGLAIVIYLNQTPLQPRERDYSYVGSFYTFSVWIGLGAAAVVAMLRRFFKSRAVIFISLTLCLIIVPLRMATENWDDHDRSHRYIARDLAYNYLNSCAPNAILFTVGDNDTFPLWYLQEVEGIRRDVCVINYGLMGFDWYIQSQLKKQYNRLPIPASFTIPMIRNGKRDFIFFRDKSEEYTDVKQALQYVKSSDVSKKLFSVLGDTLDCFETRNFLLPVDTSEIIKNGTLVPSDLPLADPDIRFRISGRYIRKEDMMLMDILAENNWKRPIYFTFSQPLKKFGLQPYLRLEGPVFRFIPIPVSDSDDFENGSVESSILYKNLMEKSVYTSISDPKVLKDTHCRSNINLARITQSFARLALQLISEEKTDSAKKVLNRYWEIAPPGSLNPGRNTIKLAEAYYSAGMYDKGDILLQHYKNHCMSLLRFFNALPPHLAYYMSNEKYRAQRDLKKTNTLLQKSRKPE